MANTAHSRPTKPALTTSPHARQSELRCLRGHRQLGEPLGSVARHFAILSSNAVFASAGGWQYGRRRGYRRTFTITYGDSFRKSGHIAPLPTLSIASMKYMKSHVGETAMPGMVAAYVLGFAVGTISSV